MDYARVILSGVLVSLVLRIGGEPLRGPFPICDFPAIYNFGDSNSDTGGFSAAFYPIPSPNGETFFGKPSGRLCDGRLIIDFIAEHLDLPHLSAYLDSIGTDYRHGANFATGGSTIRRQNETVFESNVSPFPLDIQTVHFQQFKARTSELYNQGKNESGRARSPRPKDFSRALYVLDIGQNDLSVGFRKLSNAQLRAAIPDIVNQFALAVISLYQHGARTFWIHNTGPIGCLPQATWNIKKPEPGFLDQYGCVKSQNKMAIEFNKQLKDRVRKLGVELPHAALTYVDVYAAKYRLISSTEKEGFVDPLKFCCGRHETPIHIWCGARGILNGTEVYGGTCAVPSTYVSWDGVHYSEAANHWVANHILNGSFSDPPIPIFRSCHKG